MRFEFSSDDLARMYSESEFLGGFPREVVRAYRKRVQFIAQAVDERDFYAWRSLRYKKLKGDRSDQRAMRLNDQWRLVLKLRRGEDGSIVMILSIEDYHD